MKFSISFSFVNVYALSVFKTTNTLLMLVFTLPTKVNPFATGVEDPFDEAPLPEACSL